MKASTIFSIFVVLLFLFSACNSIAPTPTATATLPAVPTAPAPAVTEAPTAVPKPADIAVGAIDSQYPEAGPKPAGATDIDPITKEWTKPNPERPNQPFFYKDRMISNEHLLGWYWEAGSAPLTDGAFGNASQVHVWCEEAAGCPKITHPANYVDNGTGLSFSTLLFGQIFARVAGVKWQFSTSEQKDTVYQQYRNNQVEIPFTTPSGGSYVYKIRPDTSMNIFIRAKPLTNPDFSSKPDSIQGSMSGNDNGDLNVAEYSPIPIPTMSHIDYLTHALYYPFVIFYTDKMTQGSVSSWIDSPGIGEVVSSSIKGSNPYFIITP